MNFNAQTPHDKIFADKMREYADALERGEGYLIQHSVLCGHRETLTFSANLRTGFGEASFEFTDFPNRRIFRAPPPTNQEMAEAALKRVHRFIDDLAARHIEEYELQGAQLSLYNWFACAAIEVESDSFLDTTDWLCLPQPENSKEKPGIFGRALDAIRDCLSFRSPI